MTKAVGLGEVGRYGMLSTLDRWGVDSGQPCRQPPCRGGQEPLYRRGCSLLWGLRKDNSKTYQGRFNPSLPAVYPWRLRVAHLGGQRLSPPEPSPICSGVSS